MNIKIKYFTKSKKGNTKKIATYLKDNLNIKTNSIDTKLESDVNILFLLNAMYANNIDKKVAKFIKENSKHIKLLVNICTSCSGRSTYKRINICCKDNNVKIAPEDKAVVGQWIFFNKNRPNEEDLNGALSFAKEVINKYSK